MVSRKQMDIDAKNICIICAILLLITTAVTCDVSQSDDFPEIRLSSKRQTSTWGSRRQRRPATGSKRSTINDALAASLDDDGDGVITRREMERFEPTTPHPDNVNCHVEVQVTNTRLLGGECIRLGSGSTFRACRSGPYLDLFSRQCNSILDDGTGAGSTPATPLSGQSGGSD